MLNFEYVGEILKCENLKKVFSYFSLFHDALQKNCFLFLFLMITVGTIGFERVRLYFS